VLKEDSMRSRFPLSLFLVFLALLVSAGQTLQAQEPAGVFQPMDVFGMEVAADPQISPDGRQVIYVRSGYDVMTDGGTSNLWIIDADGANHRPLTTGSAGHGSPRWSPDGRRLLYVSSEDGGAEIWVRWLDTGQTAKLSNLAEGPGDLAWSPDGTRVAFTMFVPESRQPLAVEMPAPPEGADWGPPIRVIDNMNYRADGNPGFVRDGYVHLFVIPAEGGTPRQLTSGPFNHTQPAWMPDGGSILISANRREDADLEGMDSEVYRVDVDSGELTPLTDRYGPDASPIPSPDGRQIAYTGFDDQLLGYQLNQLYVMNADGSGSRLLTGDFDRSVGSMAWAADGGGLVFSYDDEGNGKVAFIDMQGRVEERLEDVQGLSTGRPYGGGQFSLARNGYMAFTLGTPSHPAELGVARGADDVRQITDLNSDLLGHLELGAVEEIWWESSYDGRRVQGWIVKPPDFDPSKDYPLILEIHGGPFSNYGDRFSAEVQLYASAGYVVLYTNPRGSTSYGQEFGNLIHHAYPGQDYDDLISGVDAVIDLGYVDEGRLFVTGGSGGGVLSAWIVGHTDRFRAAVVQKPVINWYSFVLHADGPGFFYKYWFPGPPWEHMEQYMERSPLSYVGNVTTPTMLLTGERDYRTPMSESEQFFAGLQIEGVPSMLVRVPDASHGIAGKPSNLIAKVQHVLAWFEKWGEDPE
jgi:dipeptidyl aminopeptidase/acylaminoacyl peptidase